MPKVLHVARSAFGRNAACAMSPGNDLELPIWIGLGGVWPEDGGGDGNAAGEQGQRLVDDAGEGNTRWKVVELRVRGGFYAEEHAGRRRRRR